MAAIRDVDKSIFLNARACMTLGWFLRNRQIADASAPTEANEFRMEQGAEVGRRARSLFPGGVLVPRGSNADMAARTAGLMKDARVPTIFEATFVTGSMVAKADILRRQGPAWDLIEVKSSLNERAELVEDLAYTAFVAGQAGVEIASAGLMLMSREFRLGMSDDRLFAPVIDRTKEVSELIAEFARSAGAIERGTCQPERPEARFIKPCKGCSFFEDCVGKGVANHVSDLPRLSETKLEELIEQGIHSIEKIPEDFKLTDNQAVVRSAVLRGRPVVQKDRLRELLDQVVWPAAYLDFETVTTAIPLYEGIAPHQQLPTQYSIHLCERVGHSSKHFEFLADASRDCSRELAEQLVEDLSHAASIVVYSSFEKRILTGLAAAFPRLDPALQGCIGRLFDLESALRPDSFYHPGFRGRSSIKVTLPILVSDMSYEDLPIGDGDTAVAMFAKMAKGRTSADETQRIRGELLRYCGQDTLAMVKLHARLHELRAGQS
jgi:hypothetical protein